MKLLLFQGLNDITAFNCSEVFICTILNSRLPTTVKVCKILSLSKQATLRKS